MPILNSSPQLTIMQHMQKHQQKMNENTVYMGRVVFTWEKQMCVNMNKTPDEQPRFIVTDIIVGTPVHVWCDKLEFQKYMEDFGDNKNVLMPLYYTEGYSSNKEGIEYSPYTQELFEMFKPNTGESMSLAGSVIAGGETCFSSDAFSKLYLFIPLGWKFFQP